jgi:NSS family neurotransmitter:Na+ symporter
LGIALADTSVAALAGFAVFPIVFARGISPALGEELVFITMPLAFSEVPFGAFLYTLFMAMLSMAALTSAIAIFEIPLTWLTERLQVARRKAIVLLAGFLWLATMLVSFSFNLLSEFHPLDFINGFETSTLFDLVMFANLDVFFPLGALLVVIFFAYRLNRSIALDELNWKESRVITLLYFHARYLIPLAIVIMMAAS